MEDVQPTAVSLDFIDVCTLREAQQLECLLKMRGTANNSHDRGTGHCIRCSCRKSGGLVPHKQVQAKRQLCGATHALVQHQFT